MKWEKAVKNEKNIQHTYFWNMCAGMLNAFQSVILLIFISRLLDTSSVGVFSIAYATANLFLNIGKYGVRNYQVTDIRQEYTFGVYLRTRYLTTVFMLVVSIAYLIFMANQRNYSLTKTLIILVMCILKMVDSLEDVYHGFYQQKNRLDIAARNMFIRIAVTLIALIIGMFFLDNLLYALVISTFICVIFFVCSNKLIIKEFRPINMTYNIRNCAILLKNGFALFWNTFITFYIINAPKYAIDATSQDVMQANYGFISMPVFVIQLITGFIYQPLLGKFALTWKNSKTEFIKIITQQICLILCITIVVIIGASLFGIPVLSLLYNTDLSNYKTELLILLFGGGLLAYTGFVYTILTIIRAHKRTTVIYGMIALATAFTSSLLVKKYMILGASLSYVFSMMLTTICFTIVMIREIRRSSQPRLS